MANTQEFGASVTASLEELAAGSVAYGAALAITDPESGLDIRALAASNISAVNTLQHTAGGALGALAEQIGEHIEEAAGKVSVGKQDFMMAVADSQSPHVNTARHAVSAATRQVAQPAESGATIAGLIMEKTERIDDLLQAVHAELLAVQGLAEQLCGNRDDNHQTRVQSYLEVAGASMRIYGQQLGIDIVVPDIIQQS